MSFFDSINTEKIIEQINVAAHIKNLEGRKYINSNYRNLSFYGFDNPRDIIGYTVNDLDIFMNNNWGRDFAARVDEMENKVLFNGENIVDVTAMLTAFGKVVVNSMHKFPIYNRYNNKVIGIFTTSSDIIPMTG